MTGYLIGIDNGSQSTKVTVFDERGVVHSRARVPLRPNDTPRPGVVEHPDDDLWDSIGAATRAALVAFNGEPEDIIGVGLCTIRFCRALLRPDATLAQPVLSWMDERVSRPYVHVNPDVHYVTASSGYITARMTGQFRDTAANYQGMWPIDTDTWAWEDQPDIPREMLFELVHPGDELGTVTAEAAAHTGLPEGVPVFATANDKAVEALGGGLGDERTLLLSLGTYIAGMTTGTRNIHDADAFWTNFACRPKKYLYESHGIRRGMWTVSWLRDMLGEEAWLNEGAGTVPPGCDGLIAVLDWLAPVGAPFRRGAFLGFDGTQGPFHMYRAVLEAIALTMCGNGNAMAAELDTEFEQLLVSGGGAGSDVLMQIIADAFDRPARRAQGGAALGSAICAGVGLGLFGGFDEAVAAMVRPGEEFTPSREAHEHYRRLQEVYRELPTYTDPLFNWLASAGG
ncbi:MULTISPECIES: FGGY-family carbohydrate kinase [Prauserella salsuginis group]|uniref:Sugar (Pentulose or hexulose) kinase n=2 Tax=Prauserella salsuginis group TaxID=2893672 RepID=A0A839XK16_9PSEU|nr:MULTISPECIES: FGGY family carbohydrate kinase [Prauserella salsuginis group]MBB3664272.1 sugar (pentulose or hexulose) kinase [Prauserella sediminis]MCR3721717.1 Sugar (pentulose or hexulose) kinase [Prauserella flava]MCR3734409.1 Sugar (pentulose or hexulose) kinase [Prauserella salsuginis]